MPPLDLAPGAAAAYSLRKLSLAYAGPAVNVRRSSDNATQDIGFSGNDFDLASFNAFIGGGSGFIAKWYDQSGNANDAVQATAASQPQVVTPSGRPGVVGNGVNQSLTSTTGAPTGDASHTMFIVQSKPLTAPWGIGMALGTSNGANNSVSGIGTSQGPAACRPYYGGILVNLPVNNAIDASGPSHQYTKIYGSSGHATDGFFDGGNQVTATSQTYAINGANIRLLEYSGAGLSDSTLFEAILYVSASILRASIEANQRAYWGTA